MDKFKLIGEKRNDSIEIIINSACFLNNIKPNEFNIKSRERRLIDTRRMVYSIIIEVLGYGYSKIGRIFKMNHATIIHHYKLHNELKQFDRFYNDKYNSLLEIVKSELGFVDIDNIIKEAKKINLEREKELINLKKTIREL